MMYTTSLKRFALTIHLNLHPFQIQPSSSIITENIKERRFFLASFFLVKFGVLAIVYTVALISTHF